MNVIRISDALSLNRVRKLIVDRFGEDAINLILYLSERSYVQESIIMNDTGIPQKSLQRSLLRMESEGVVDCKKEVDNKSYVTYYWKLDIGSLERFIYENTIGKFDALIDRLEAGEELYYCPSCSQLEILHYDSEEAIDYKFKCPECGSELVPLTTETVENLKRNYLK
ncbi:MAG: hypothetical protein NZ908_01320 [Candidatus Micrarchaeota archaeon]|nr:hypothetical protein [Candidatus Micrarchaeota archaeon]MCX8154363.1 hypothetical protein [Candidatus Micrarchaeota archaeon]